MWKVVSTILSLFGGASRLSARTMFYTVCCLVVVNPGAITSNLMLINFGCFRIMNSSSPKASFFWPIFAVFTCLDQSFDSFPFYYALKIVIIAFIFESELLYRIQQASQAFCKKTETADKGEISSPMSSSSTFSNYIDQDVSSCDRTLPADCFEDFELFRAPGASPTGDLMMSSAAREPFGIKDQFLGEALPRTSFSANDVIQVGPSSIGSSAVSSKTTRNRSQFQRSYSCEYWLRWVEAIESGSEGPKLSDYESYAQQQFPDVLLSYILMLMDRKEMNPSKIGDAFGVDYFNNIIKKNLRGGALLFGYAEKWNMDHFEVARAMIVSSAAEGKSDSCRGLRELISECSVPEKVTLKKGDKNMEEDNANNRKTSLAKRLFGKLKKKKIEVFMYGYYDCRRELRTVDEDDVTKTFFGEGEALPYGSHLMTQEKALEGKGRLRRIYKMTPF